MHDDDDGDDVGDGVREGKDAQWSRAQQKGRHLRPAGGPPSSAGEEIQTIYHQGQVTISFNSELQTIYCQGQVIVTNDLSPRPGNY